VFDFCVAARRQFEVTLVRLSRIFPPADDVRDVAERGPLLRIVRCLHRGVVLANEGGADGTLAAKARSQLRKVIRRRGFGT
jgi:hypothetical protein